MPPVPKKAISVLEEYAPRVLKMLTRYAAKHPDQVKKLLTDAGILHKEHDGDHDVPHGHSRIH